MGMPTIESRLEAIEGSISGLYARVREADTGNWDDNKTKHVMGKPTIENRLEAIEDSISGLYASCSMFKPEKKVEIGDRCAFWDGNKTKHVVGELIEINDGFRYRFQSTNGLRYKNCAKIKKEAEF